MFTPQAPGMAPPAPQPGAPAAPGQPQGGFYQQQQVPGVTPPGPTGAPSQTLFQEKIDFNIKIPDRLFQFTARKIPQTPAMAMSSKIPLGGILRPLAPCSDGVVDVDTVQPGSAGIIRCKRCRTYINAFVHWLEHGRRWRCNICAQINDTPAAYFCHLDDEGLRRDRNERPELSKGVVEFIAPAEYMVRPPQEPSYFFVLDVSATAVRSGMLHAAANAIKRSLDDLPGRGRTKIGFITFDNSVHYYNLGSDLSQPQMLVVSDWKELFVPLPDNLLVNLEESRSVVETFLDNIPEMFSKNPVVSQSCLGPALKAAFTVMKQVGGKMSVFQTIMPSIGDGALKPRENQAFMGTPNEVKLLRPQTSWYKDTAIEFSRQQISVDMFLFPYQYMDLAALGDLPKMTGGNMYSYVMFNFDNDGQRFEDQLHKTLVQDTAFEAVMRIRCTKGMRITNFYGNFFIRGTDLMALPNVNSESVFGFDLVHDEQNVASNYVTVQAALLYTSSAGQRRIRVMTQALPITGLTSELLDSVNTQATCNLLCKQAVDVSLKSNIDNARMRLQQTCVDIMRASKGGDKRTVSGYTVPQGPQPGEDEDKPTPETLQLIPLYTLAMMKNVAFRGGTDVHPDERIQAFHLINQMWTSTSKYFIYPRLFSLHDMGSDVGYPYEETTDDTPDEAFVGRDRVLLPQTLSLSVDNLSSDGIYLLDNGVEMFIWVGRSADPNTVNSLFGAPSLENVDPSQIKLQLEGDDYASRVGAIVTGLREDEADDFFVGSKVQIVREGDGHMESRFFWFLVEDPASFQGGTYSYEGEFIFAI
jgi:protein transport protein SEC24